MTWTKDKPEKTGMYWFQGIFGDADTGFVRCDIPVVLEVIKHGGLYAKIPGRHWWLHISLGCGEWAGPIECPQ